MVAVLFRTYHEIAWSDYCKTGRSGHLVRKQPSQLTNAVVVELLPMFETRSCMQAV